MSRAHKIDFILFFGSNNLLCFQRNKYFFYSRYKEYYRILTKNNNSYLNYPL